MKPHFQRLSIAFIGGIGSNLAIPVVSYAIAVGHRVVSVPSVKYPARNQELQKMGVEFVEDLDKLEAIQRNVGHDNVRNMAFSMNTKSEDLLRFAPLGLTLHTSTAAVAPYLLNPNQPGRDALPPYIRDKLAATRVQHANLTHVLLGFVIPADVCNYRGSNQTDRGMSGKTCARLFDPFGTGSIKEPDAWWFDYKSLTPQDFFTVACAGWFDRSAARSGVYRLTTNEEYSRYRIASLYLRGKFTDARPNHPDHLCRPISYSAIPLFQFIDMSDYPIEMAIIRAGDSFTITP